MSRFFINRPVTAIVISILIVIVGVVLAQRLPIAQFPAIAPPEIVVTTNYVGADALTIESAVATPIEEAMAGVEGMLYMRSFNANDGTMKLRVDFDLNMDPNVAEVFSEIRVNRALPQLPPSVRNQGVTIAKSHVSPLMIIALYAPKGTRDAKFLANYANINIADPLTRVTGIGSIVVQGAGAYAMRQWVKPDQLASLGVTVPDLVNALEQQNTVNPSGQVGAEPAPSGQEFTYTMRAQGRLVTEEDFGNIVIRENPDGSVIRMKDVARIELGAQTYNVIGRMNDAPAAIINVFQLPGYNAIDAVDGVRKMLAQLKEKFPDDVDYVVSLDTTLSVREGVREIITTLAEALLLVIFVVFLFLQNVRATLIPALTVPVSLLGTFIFFPMLGFSINSLSLFGLVLAIGLVVDDAIVVVEAVETNIAAGLKSKGSLAKGNGTGWRPRSRDCPYSCCSLCSHRFYSRNHRPSVSAVCRDHRGLCGDLRLQRSIAESRAVFSPIEATPGVHRFPASCVWRVQSSIRQSDESICQHFRHAHPKNGFERAPAVRGSWRSSSGGVQASFRISSYRRSRLFLFEHPVAGCGLAPANGRFHQESRSGSQEHAGCSVLQHHRGQQPPHANERHIQRLRVRSAEAMGPAQK